MIFIINNKKYDTDNMDKISDKVKKWFPIHNFFTETMYPDKEVGKYFECELWKSKKGNYLLTFECDYIYKGQAITEEESQKLLLKYDWNHDG